MKKRLEKKVEKMYRKKVHEILEMVLEINGTHSRQRALTGNKPTAFFHFSGHTAGVAVSVYTMMVGTPGTRVTTQWNPILMCISKTQS